MISSIDVNGSIAEIKLWASQAVDVADESLRETAWDIADLAKAYVPVDKYNLQDSITVEGTPDGYKVYIDLSHEGTRAPTVERYALKMENGVGWSGIARAGPPRGAQFMARAYNETMDQLGRKISETNRKMPSRGTLVGRILGAAGSFANRLGSGAGSFIKRLFG
jgi:hypothetical protein